MPDRQLLAGLLFLLSTAGFCGNVAVVQTFVRYKIFHSAPYIWMGAIGVADMLMCVWYGYYPALGILLNSELCAFVKSYWMLAQSWFLLMAFYVGLNVNRFLVICLPPGHRWALKAKNVKSAWLVLALIVAANLVFEFVLYIWNTPPIIYFMPEIYTPFYNTTLPETEVPMMASLHATCSKHGSCTRTG